MKKNKSIQLDRRNFLKISAATTAGVSMLPLGACNLDKLPKPMKRKFGNFNFDVTTLGLGGQASLMWTADDIDPIQIILKAFELGINYFDTSNLYKQSQLNLNKAFRKLNLIPGEENYNEELRNSVWLTSKTAMRWGSTEWEEKEHVGNWSNGENVKCAVDDVRRSLTQLFGDNKGWYPEGSYLNMVLIHALRNTQEVDVLYKGLETPLNPNGQFGALVALRDLRDGTNLTGMNPKNEKLIKHIGFSGHHSPPAMIDMIQRDEYGILEGMLIAINANDKQMFNMQNNVIPVAEAKGLGIIGMKVFADAAMYHKEPRWSKNHEDVFRKVGTPDVPSRPLIEYSLTTQGVHTLIIGIGYIDDDPMKCQLVQNYYASQISPDGLSTEERVNIEKMTASIKEGKTNYFQMGKMDLSAPREVKLEEKDGQTYISWQTAYAGDYPISHYEIYTNGEKAGQVEHTPQIYKSNPFKFLINNAEASNIAVKVVDKGGNMQEGFMV